MCVGHNIQPIRTIYRWQSRVHDKTEGRVALRTQRSLLPQIIDRVKRDQPYEVLGVVAWRTWSNRWTAEEGRHAVVLRDYLLVTRNIDPVALERGRMATVQQGWMPNKTALGLMAYAAFQARERLAAHLAKTDRLASQFEAKRMRAAEAEQYAS